jgi:N-acetylglutamate synthase-like GNAT family acetyltransferase
MSRMEIRQTTNIGEILRCVPFETEIRDNGRDNSEIKDLLYFLQEYIETPVLRMWIAYDDDKIIGYCVAMVSMAPGMKGLILLRMYAKQREIREGFEEVLREWAKETGCKKAYMIAHKNIKAFQRRYGFKPVSVIMERRI